MIELDSNYLNAFLNRAEASRELGQYESALSDLNFVLLKGQIEASIFSSIGITKGKMNDFEGSIYAINKAIEMDPDDLSYIYNRSLIEYDFKDYNGALRDLNIVLKSSPNDEWAIYHRGLTKIMMKDSDSGCEDLKKSSQLGNKLASEKIQQYCH